MTLKPEELNSHPTVEPIDPAKTAILEDMFYLGYATSNKITIYADDEGNEYTAKFRTLTPTELRSIFETSVRFSSLEGQDITNKIEILARAITHINDMPLILTTKDREDFFQKYKKEPTPLDQARYILTEKISSIHMLNLLYEAYSEFSDSIRSQFDDIKKKLKTIQYSK